MGLSDIKTIGLIGAGLIGSQLARLSVANDLNVVISNSRGPESLTDLIEELGPRARAGTVQEAAEAGDVVVVTIPLKDYRTAPPEPLAGKVVIDTANLYEVRDGKFPELEAQTTTATQLLQDHLPASKVVKAFNHIEAAQLTEHAQPAGTPDRRALAIAGDDDDAVRLVTELIDAYGFDVVNAGPLVDSWRLEHPNPVFGPRGDVANMTERVAAATRRPGYVETV